MTVLSTLRVSKSDREVMERKKASRGTSPAIDFYVPQVTEEQKNEEGKHKDKDQYQKFEVPLNLKDADSSSYSVYIRVFRNGTPEEYCAMRESVETLAERMGYKSGLPADLSSASHAQLSESAKSKMSLYASVLDGKARSHYENTLAQNRDTNRQHERLSLALNEVAKHVFEQPEDAYKIQRTYLRKSGLLMFKNKPSDFFNRLELIGKTYLPFFPRKIRSNGKLATNKPLDDEDIKEILDESRSPAIQKLMIQSRDNVDKHETAESYVQSLDSWYDAHQLQTSLEQREQGNGKRKASDDDGSQNKKKKAKNSNKEAGRSGRTKPCAHCGKWHMQPDDKCWTLEKNKKSKGKDHYKTKSQEKSDKSKMKEVASYMMKMFQAEATKLDKKRKGNGKSAGLFSMLKHISSKEDTDSEKEEQSDSDSDNEDDKSTVPPYLYTFSESTRPQKKSKKEHYTAEVIIEIEDRDGNLVPARGLLDTGTTSSLLLRQFVRKGRAQGYKGKKVTWNTMGGNFVTNRKALVDFKFPELSDSKKVTWICHVDGSTPKDKAMYDIIIGMDLMTEIGIVVDTDAKEIRWEGHTTPLKLEGHIQDDERRNMVYTYAKASTPTLTEAEE